MKFKVGDLVVISNPKYADEEAQKGMVGKIKRAGRAVGGVREHYELEIPARWTVFLPEELSLAEIYRTEVGQELMKEATL